MSTAPAPARLLLATTNAGKIREIRAALGDLSIDLVTLADLPAMSAPEETGRTFAENALLKARAYWEACRIPTVAEDSGLAIDALGGRPGVESARYPGETYADKFAGLFHELAPHPRPWTAQFVCALALVDHDGEPAFETEATVTGEITTSPAGTNGFGYDPIFLYPPYGLTLAQVDDEQKLAVSHRGRAFRRLRAWIVDTQTRPTG